MSPRLQNIPHETKLIPAGHHSALVVQIVCFLLRQCDLQGSVFGGDGSGVIPLEVARLLVMKVDGFPVWIVAGVESPTAVVEFVKEDQL